MATVRPPRKGPIQRQRISENSFWSYCCAHSGNAIAAVKLANRIQRALLATGIGFLQGTRENNSDNSEGQTGRRIARARKPLSSGVSLLILNEHSPRFTIRYG